MGKAWSILLCEWCQCFRFCKLQGIKNWTVGRPRNEASSLKQFSYACSLACNKGDYSWDCRMKNRWSFWLQMGKAWSILNDVSVFFCILQAVKNWTVGGPRYEANSLKQLGLPHVTNTGPSQQPKKLWGGPTWSRALCINKHSRD